MVVEQLAAEYQLPELAELFQHLEESKLSARNCHWHCGLNGYLKTTHQNSDGARAGHCQPRLIIRPYNHGTDFDALQDICKDVYGGEDELPQAMDKVYSKKDCYVSLVATTGDEEDAPAVIAFVTLCLWKNRVAWLSGLRVHKGQAGAGLGTVIMRCALTVAIHLRVRTVMMSTDPSNRASIRIMQKLGVRFIEPVLVWPSLKEIDAICAADAKRTANGAVTCGGPEPTLEHPDLPPTSNSEEAGTQGSAAPSILEAGGLPPVEDPVVRQLASRWRQSRNLEEVEAYLRATRDCGTEVATPSPPFSCSDDPRLELWLPRFYYVEFSCGEWLEQAVEEGNVWVLSEACGSCCGDCQAGDREPEAPTARHLAGHIIGVMFVGPGDRNLEARCPGLGSVSIVATSLEVAKAGLLYACTLRVRFHLSVDIQRWNQKLSADEGEDCYSRIREEVKKLSQDFVEGMGGAYFVLGMPLPQV